MKMVDITLAKIFLFAFSYPKTLAFLCLFCFLTVSYLVWNLYYSKKLIRAQRETDTILKEALETQPDGYYLWQYDSVGFLNHTFCSARLAVMLNLPEGIQSTFETVLERFAPDSSEQLSAALTQMRSDDLPFALELSNGKQSFLVNGSRRLTEKQKGLLDILWIRDITDCQLQNAVLSDKNKKLIHQTELYEHAFNALPFPVWLRNKELQISACNTAYAKAMHAASLEDAVAQGGELVYEKAPREARVLAASARAAGKERRAKEFVVMDGKRKRVEVSEIPLRDQRTIGFVRDITPEQDLQKSLENHISSHNGVLEHLKTAIAVFDAETRLQFYNTAFLNLWDLEEEWLDGSPTYSHFLDMLREKRRLPENRDFSAYKAKELKYFSSLVSETFENIHLPSGVTLRRMLTPHPLGGLLITYEDVTGHLTMERSMTVLNETQETVLNHLREAVLLFGRDGRLKLANQAYKELWQLDQTAPYTIVEIIDKQKPFFESRQNWESLREQLLSVITSHTGETFQVMRPDGKIIEFSAYSVPGGGIFVSFIDISHEEKSAAEAMEKDKILSRLKQAAAQTDKLRETFLNRLRTEILAAPVTESKILLDQMSDLALIETGSTVLELDSIDIASVLMGLIRATTERARLAEISLELNPMGDLPQIVADKKRLKQALFALLNTAIDDAKRNTTISLSVIADKRHKILAMTIFFISESDSIHYDLTNRFESAMGKNLIEIHGGKVSISGKNDGTEINIEIPMK